MPESSEPGALSKILGSLRRRILLPVSSSRTGDEASPGAGSRDGSKGAIEVAPEGRVSAVTNRLPAFMAGVVSLRMVVGPLDEEAWCDGDLWRWLDTVDKVRIVGGPGVDETSRRDIEGRDHVHVRLLDEPERLHVVIGGREKLWVEPEHGAHNRLAFDYMGSPGEESLDFFVKRFESLWREGTPLEDVPGDPSGYGDLEMETRGR